VEEQGSDLTGSEEEEEEEELTKLWPGVRIRIMPLWGI